MHNNHADTCAAPRIIKHVDAAEGASAVASLPADPTQFFVVDWIAWSYSGDPEGGKLTIDIGGESVELDITRGGPGILNFDKPFYFDESKNKALTITLAGCEGVSGKVWARVR